MPDMLKPDVTLLFQAALFLTLLFLLNRLMLRPLVELFARRDKAHEEPRKTADILRREAEELEAQVRGRLIKIKADADVARSERIKTASIEAAERISGACRSAEQSSTDSRQKIAFAEDEARRELDDQVSTLAERIVERVLEGTV